VSINCKLEEESKDESVEILNDAVNKSVKKSFNVDDEDWLKAIWVIKLWRISQLYCEQCMRIIMHQESCIYSTSYYLNLKK